MAGGTRSFFFVQGLKEVYLNDEFGPFAVDTFRTISNHDAFWDWMGSVLVPHLRQSELYAGLPLPEEEDGYLQGQQFLLGAVRIRQVRSETQIDDCRLPAKFKDRGLVCRYEPGDEARC